MQQSRRLGEVKAISTGDVIQGYESLFNKLHQFNTRLNKPCIERCHLFIRRLSRIKQILNDRIKVSQVYTREPHFTHKAKQNLTYQKIFLLMIEWSRFGRPDWSLQNELNSIQDLSKLFEFYLFCVVKEHILNYSRQFNGGLIESPIDGTNDSRFVFQITKELKGELLYEPNIFNSDIEDALLRDYRNTEAWKRSGESFRLRKDKKYTKDEYRFRRTPDVVFCLTNGDVDSILIMDAKYMQSQKAFHEAMPECVMKYIHGIHHAKTGKNTSIGLMIVNPDEADITRHYHHDEYTIFGETPVLPAIMTASIDVSKAHKFNSTIQKNIFRFLELMILHLNPNGFDKVNHDAREFYEIESVSYNDFGFDSDGHNIITGGEVNVLNMTKLDVQKGGEEKDELKLKSDLIVTDARAQFEQIKTKSKKSVASQSTKGLVSIDLIKFPDSYEKPKNKSRQLISKKKR